MRAAAFAGALALSVATHARADGAHRESAVELFAHGRALAAAGKCREAVPYFLDTLKIEASVGALLNLAECNERLGALGDAYSRYREAESIAGRQRDDREALARSRAEALTPRLPKLRIAALANVHVTIDDAMTHGPVTVVSPGDHVVVVSEAGKASWHSVVSIEGTETRTIVVPMLRALPVPAPQRNGAPQRTAGLVVLSTGIAGVALGGIFAGVAAARKNDASTLATGPSQTAFQDARASAKTFADASTVFFVGGALCAAAGLLIWLTAPRTRIGAQPEGAISLAF